MQVQSIESFLEYFGGIRQRTRRAVVTIPPDRLEWAPAAGRWSFGDIVRHLAGTERFMFTENVLGRPSSYPGHDRALADGGEAVLAYLDRLHEESVLLLSDLTAADLQRRCVTPAGTPITTWKWLRAMVEHEVHHRGQMHLMLSLIGVRAAPLFGLTEEEVHALSRSGPDSPSPESAPS